MHPLLSKPKIKFFNSEDAFKKLNDRADEPNDKLKRAMARAISMQNKELIDAEARKRIVHEWQNNLQDVPITYKPLNIDDVCS